MIYKEWEDYLEELENDEQIGQLFKALFAFAKRGEEAEFKGALKMAFVLMRNAIERDGQKWEKTCSKNRDNIQKRWNKSEQADTTVYDRIPPYTNYTDKVKDKDKDKDNDKDKVKEPLCFAGNTGREHNQTPETNSYGQHNNVNLTIEQYNSLVFDYGQAVIDDYIERISRYIKDNSKKPYDNHYQTICDWLNKDGVKKKTEHSYNLDLILQHSLNTNIHSTQGR